MKSYREIKGGPFLENISSSIQLGKQDQTIFSLTATMFRANVLNIVWIKFLPLYLNYVRELCSKIDAFSNCFLFLKLDW